MFLQYAPAGAVLPLYSFQLQALGFGPLEMAWCCATQALACIVGPLAAGQVADRWVAAERVLAVCAALSGLLLVLLTELTSPVPVFLTTLGFWLVACPIFTLGTAICFTHAPEPNRDYGPIRMWGTVGWVSAALFLGHWYSDPSWLCDCCAWMRPDWPRHRLTDAYRIGAVIAFLLTGYALTLPHTPPRRRASSWLAPLAAVRLLRRRAFAVYFMCSLLLYTSVAFSSQVTPLLLSSLGIADAWLPAALTISQSTEIVSLGLLPVFLSYLGVRGCMLLGVGTWLLAMCILTIGQPVELVVCSLALNGLFITGFVVAGQVFINRHAPDDIRASAQALLTCMMGAGLLAGNLLVGAVRRAVDGAFAPTFAVAAGLTALLLVFFVLGFDEDEAEEVSETEVAEESGFIADPCTALRPGDSCH
jgi:MFS family permease